MCDDTRDDTRESAHGQPSGERPRRTRRRLWELEEKYHCPVIGTCLGLAELERLARRSGYGNRIGRTEAYTLHVEAVSLSLERNAASETMQKWLERKYALIVRRFDQAKHDAEVLAHWKTHLERGEVAGAVWAAMTHKAASATTRNAVYADLHMLSHQVGAGQAADLLRLQGLEREHVALRGEHARLKTEQALAHAETLRLRQELAVAREQQRQQEPRLERLRELESGQAIVALGRRLLMAQAQAERVHALDQRLHVAETRVGALRADKARLARELHDASQERDALERLWGPEPAAACNGDCAACEDRLAGRCLLCVGGRTGLLPQYRQLAERLGLRLIYHDGGREEALSRLPEMLSACDAVICPTDCVGHLAYFQVKKHCKQAAKPCVLAKSSGVAGFAAALNRLADGRADIHPEVHHG